MVSSWFKTIPRAKRVSSAVSLLLVATLAFSLQNPQVASASASPPSPVRLTVGGLDEPADLDVATPPSFSWVVPTGAMQSRYQLGVSSSEAAASRGEWDVWAPAAQNSSRQSYVAYEGPALRPERQYFWSVRFWDGAGVASDWAAPNGFGTAPSGAWANSTPIWLAGPEAYGDFSMSATVTLGAGGAAALRFRSDASNGYFWQVRTDGIRPHKVVNNGTSTLVAANGGTVAYPAGTAVREGVAVRVRIDAVGQNIKTYINEVLVYEVTDGSFSAGSVGLRTGRTEAFVLDDFSLTSGGSVRVANDFSSSNPFACGAIADGRLQVGVSSYCLLASSAGDWMLARKSFDLSNKEISRATLFATGTDYNASKAYVYKAAVNGVFVGLGPTSSLGGESRFDGFDVTDQLRSGSENVVSLMAYNTASQRKVQARLVVAYADGSSSEINTGGDWKVFDATASIPSSRSIGTSYFRAPSEDTDFRRFPSGWDQPDFDDSDWAAATERPAFTRLTPTPMGKVEQQLHAPVRVIDKGDGDYFIDFGRTWIGGVRWAVESPRDGHVVDIRFGEVTSAENTVRYQLNTGNVYQDRPTLRAGEQVIETWGARVFRYVEILDSPEPITAESLSALALVYPFDPGASTFSASDRNLEQVYELSKNTIEATNLNFYTDSWTRERTNYEADAYLQQMSSLYLMEDLSLARYSMEYFKTNRTWPTEWPIYVVLAVHDAWRQTGDSSQLSAYYDSLKTKLPDRWFEASSGLIRKTDRSNGCNSQTDCDIVDWPGSQRDGYVFAQYNTVLNAISYRAYRDMAAIASELGMMTDARLYTDRATAIAAAVNERLYNEQRGAYDDGLNAQQAPTGHYSLHASAFALSFGLVPEERQDAVATYLESRGMACSVYCAAFLIKGLYDAGAGDTALDLLTHEGTSSWMNMIRLGAGATAEAWDPSQKSNLTYSHPWAASPAFTVPAGLFGVQPTSPGYSTFDIAPSPGGLERASLTVPTVKGSIGVNFRSVSDGYDLTVSVPGNTTAAINVPTNATDGEQVNLWVDGRERAFRAEGGAVRVETVESGCHVIASTRSAGLDFTGEHTDVCETAAIDLRRAPESPTAPTASLAGNSISVTWEEPASEGAEIDSYTVTLRSDSGGERTLAASADQRSVTFTDLPAGTWRATVSATNTIGVSAPSLASRALTIVRAPDPTDQPDPAEPSAPTDPGLPANPTTPVDNAPSAPPAADLTDENRSDVQAPATAAAGSTITVQIGRDLLGQRVWAWLYSTPVALGSDVVDVEGSTQFRIPSDTPAGLHRIAVVGSDGDVIGWDTITITRDERVLSRTGAMVSSIAGTALLLLLSGAALIAMRRKRKA